MKDISVRQQHKTKTLSHQCLQQDPSSSKSSQTSVACKEDEDRQPAVSPVRPIMGQPFPNSSHLWKLQHVAQSQSHQHGGHSERQRTHAHHPTLRSSHLPRSISWQLLRLRLTHLDRQGVRQRHYWNKTAKYMKLQCTRLHLLPRDLDAILDLRDVYDSPSGASFGKKPDAQSGT